MKQFVINNRVTNRETESFKQYLKDIAEINLLSPEEEIICTNKAKTGDREAINELVRKNLRFVVSVAKKYESLANPLEDLVNEGNIGLIMAAERFKPEMGYKFITYAVWWIQKIIIEHITKNGRMIRLPANKLTSLSKLDNMVSDLEQQLCRNVDIQEIIDVFGDNITKEDFTLIDILGSYSMDSLDREISNDDGNHSTLSDMLYDESDFKLSDNLMDDNDIKKQLNKVIDTLKPRDKRIMIAIYGLDGNPPMALKEVSDEIGISREMVRQVKEKSLVILKNKLKKSIILSY